jgi:glucose-1-phosphate thymidylyltransferase
MKGVILAGGSGSRLYPLTISVNKHLLPVGNKPMVLHCVERMVESGITDILIVTNPEYVGNFSMLLKSGEEFGCNITYKTQDKPDGVAGALYVAKDFVGNDNCMVILGDNMFNFNVKEEVKEFEEYRVPGGIRKGCHLFFKDVPDGHRYGIGYFDEDELVKLEEKPEGVGDAFACIGVYIFNSIVFNIIKNLKPSDRGEYEIADVINQYIDNNNVTFSNVDGWWTDAGTPSSYKIANEMMYE